MTTEQMAALPLVHCWGHRDGVPELGPELHGFDHADPARGRVTFHRDTLPKFSRFWVVYVRSRIDWNALFHEGAGQIVREACPLPYQESAASLLRYGKRREVQCHTDRRHPWNDGASKPGYHFCGACGYPAWIEFHGVADGFCQCCGYQG